jgi:RHS repeat-associated protein
MSGQAAARLGDPVAHTAAMGGFEMGGLVGAAVGIAALAFVIGTGGTGAIVIAAAGAVAATGGGALAGMHVGEAYTTTTGAIVSGSGDVLVNGRHAARAIIDTAACSNHSSPQKIAQGSQSVFIDKNPAARAGDQVTCAAVIAAGSPNVFFGAAPGDYLSVSPEVPAWMVRTAAVMAIAGTAVALGVGAAAAFAAGGLCGAAAFGVEAAAGIGGSVLGSAALGAIGEALGGAKGRAWGEVLGGVAGGALGGAAGSELANRTLEGHPVDVATGELCTTHTDFVLGGPLPLVFTRMWFSSSTLVGELGHGWHHALDMAVVPLPSRERLVLRLADGRLAFFMPPTPGAPSLNTVERMQLWTDGRRLWATDYTARRYEFGPPAPDGGHRLVQVSDPNGNAITLARDPAGKLERITDSAGRVITVRRDAAGHMLTLDGPAPDGEGRRALVSFTYDAAGDLIAATDAAGGTFHYQYTNRLLVQERRPAGICFHFRWDDLASGRNARCVETWGDPLAGAERLNGRRLQYDVQAHCTQVRDDADRSTRHDWDDRGLVVATVDPLGGRTVMLRDEAGRLTSRLAPDGSALSRSYDAFGRLLTVTQPDGAATRFTYPDRGVDGVLTALPSAVTLPDGGTVQRRYDDRLNLVVATDAAGWQTRVMRDTRGLPLAVQDPAGVRARYTWSNGGELLGLADATGFRRTYTRDRLGRTVSVEETRRPLCTLERDPVGRVVALRRAGGGTIQLGYDAEGNITRHRDALGQETAWAYAGTPLPHRRVAANGAVTQYHYDGELRLVGLTNAKGESYRIEYDALGRLEREIGFDGRELRYLYDEAGWLCRLEDCGVGTDYLRSKGGRLLERRYADGTAERFSYDPSGRLLFADNARRRVRFVRDLRGDVVEEHQDGLVLRHIRDGRGRVRSMTLPDGRVVQISHDAAGRFTAVTFAGRLVTELRRDGAGREVARRAGVLTCWTEYDPQGRLLRQQARLAPDRDPVLARSYDYDEADRLIALGDLQSGLSRYTYDAADVLTGVDSDAPEHFVTDPTGNLLLTGDDLSMPAVATGDRLLLQGDRKFEYDDRGNRVRERRGAGGGVLVYYRYDDANRLVAVEESSRLGRRLTRFDYDALGRRVRKITEATPATPANDAPDLPAAHRRTTYFLWQGDVLLAEAEAEGDAAPADPLATVYLHEPGTARPLAQVCRPDAAAPEVLFHYHLDQIGTPREVTNDMGELVWSAELTAWGAMRRQRRAAASNPLRFLGQYCDVETGLHYNRHRFYDPTTASFLTQDPVGLQGGTNLYRYVPNPTAWVDPLGLTPCFFGGADRAAAKGFPGIGTTPNGGPTFEGTPYLYNAQPGESNIVNITLTGSREDDFDAANAAAGLSSKPDGYTWHHVDDFDPETGTSSMELVQSDAHRATLPHKGSAGQYQDYNGVKYQ